MNQAIENFKQIFAELQAHRALPALAGTPLAWLERERELAVEKWSVDGLPTRKLEAWKYTSVQAISDAEIVDAGGPDARALAELESVHESARMQVAVAAELVFVNGRFIPQWSTLPHIAGLHVLSLAAALRSDVPYVRNVLSAMRETFGSAAHKGAETAFAALNTSLFRDAAVVIAEDDCFVGSPIILTFIQSGTASSRVAPQRMTAVYPKVLAHFGRHSQGHVIENHIGPNGATYVSTSLSDLHLGDSSHVSYVKLQREGDHGFHVGTTRVFQARDSRLDSLQISLGAKLARHDLKVRLAAPGAEAVVDGLYIVRDHQHVDNHTAIEHAVGDTRSDQLYKGVLDDESRAVFNGRIWINQDAQRSNSSQLNNNLILSMKAEIDTKPELEIFADDVKAGHGATVGRLDPEHLFYFQSRAIDPASAVAMLAEGFAQEVVFRRGSAVVREALLPLVRQAVRGLKVSVR
ncbi:MAG: Fe-S cluster assembly protein SufD [Bdellovibrionaceae bacterium]|nr:Fe-S cluster assembly protein SufD [Pseudobdellovibrionaceae bacterium]